MVNATQVTSTEREKNTHYKPKWYTWHTSWLWTNGITQAKWWTSAMGGILFGYLPTCLRGTDSPCGCLEWLHAIKMNCSSSVFMTWRRCVVRGNIAEMVNRDRCICLLLMGASKATMLMSSSAADSGHLLGGKPLLSIHISNQTNSHSNWYVFLRRENLSCIRLSVNSRLRVARWEGLWSSSS